MLPVRVGGHVALDFCNTAAGWGEPERKEYLATFEHLAVWAREAGLVEAASAPPGAADQILGRALRFREALYPVLLERADEDDWSIVAAEIERAAQAARFRAPGTWTVSETPDRPLLVAARAAGELLATARTAIRACPGHGCGWLFLDPRGRRRWCDMAVCGNRSKARRHAARSRGR